ncbi:hypothetical protein K4F52_007976 [Lecanicillium sp. MT-2017a]|nr:hypothetical protein K4F52_007976 [Lecanicillium sp. MT-2017a]
MAMFEVGRRALSAVTADDQKFGPQQGNKHDFTLLFEHTILTMVPTIMMIVVAPFFIRHYSRQPIYVKRGAQYWIKTATSVSFIAVETASLVLWSLPRFRTPFSVSAAALSLLSALVIAALLNAEHRRALRPSSLVSFYVAIGIALDIVKIRSYFFRHGLHVIGGVSCASAALKAMLLALGEVSKRSQFLDPGLKKSLGRESVSGFWNRSFFVWLNKTFLLGFRRIIRNDDLDELGPEFSTEMLAAKFHRRWVKMEKSARHCLLKASLSSLGGSFYIIILPRLCHIVFYFTQPFLLRDVVTYYGRAEAADAEYDALIVATILLYTGLAVSRAWYEHTACRASIFLRGMLSSEVFQKTMVLSHDRASDNAAMTLMSTDVNGIVDGTRMFVETAASFVETLAGIGLLATVTKAAQMVWNKAIEARVSETSKVISQIKSIKMAGHVPEMVEYLQSRREEEVEQSKKYRLLSAVMTSTGLLGYCLTPVVVIAGALFWTTFKDDFNPVDVFTTLAIIGLVALPLGHVMAGFPRLAGALGCFLRVEAYLLLPEKQEQRTILNEGRAKDPEPLSLTEKEGSVWMPAEVQHADTETFPIEFINASIAPSTGKDAVVCGISVRIARGKLTVMVGRTASGKSTILRAMIGEAEITQGVVQLEHCHIAYCGQDPWIMNATIQENIVGNCILDLEWLKTILYVCCLQEDIDAFTKGLETLAGSGGLHLSGGQRQRIALARALYIRAPVVLLDDILSSVDHATATAILERLFSPRGLLRRLNCTVVVTTHSETLARAADQILLLDGSGSVRLAESPEDGGLGKSLTIEDLKTLQISEGDETGAAASDDSSLAQKEAQPDADPAARQKGDVSLYLLYFQPVMKRVMVAWLVTTVLYSIAERAPEIYVRIWLDVDANNKLFFIGYALLGALSGIFPMAMLSIFWLYLVPQTSEGLHKMLVDTAMRATLPYLSSTDIGSLLNRFSQDMTLISQSVSEYLWVVTYDSIITIIDIGIIAAASKYLAIAIPLILIAVYYIQLFYLRTSRQIRHLDLETKTPLYTQFSEMASGIEHIRCFGWQERSLTKNHELMDRSQRPAYAMFCIQRWLNITMDMITLVLATVIVSFAFYVDAVSQSGLGLALLNITSFSQQLGGTIKMWTGLETALGALARLREFMKVTPVEQEDDSTPPATLPVNWPNRGEVDFRNLSVAYRDDSPKIIRNFSLKINSGQKVGIVGRTGSGKTTMFLALLRFLKYTGSVIIDGFEISTVPLAILRTRITTIPQDFVQYPGSIRDNLVPQDIMKHGEPSVKDSTLQEILDKVGAGIRQNVDLHGGLDAPIESLGLSAGQKQLMSVARAIVHKRVSQTKLILIDEGTSNVDPQTDATIQTLMDEFFQGSTVISISHRPETIQNADVVYTLDREATES